MTQRIAMGLGAACLALTALCTAQPEGGSRGNGRSGSGLLNGIGKALPFSRSESRRGGDNSPFTQGAIPMSEPPQSSRGRQYPSQPPGTIKSPDRSSGPGSTSTYPPGMMSRSRRTMLPPGYEPTIGSRSGREMTPRSNGKSPSSASSPGSVRNSPRESGSDTPVRSSRLKNLTNGNDSPVRRMDNSPAYERSASRLIPGYDRPAASPVEMHNEIKSASRNLRDALKSRDSESASDILDSLRNQSMELKGRLRNLPPDQKLQVGLISRMYDEGAALIEQGQIDGSQSKMDMGMEKIETANESLRKLEKR